MKIIEKNVMLSNTMRDFDYNIYCLEQDNEILRNKVEELNKELCKIIHERFEEGLENSKRLFSAATMSIISSPQPEDIGAIGIMELTKILHMDKLEDIKKYIKKILKDKKINK